MLKTGGKENTGKSADGLDRALAYHAFARETRKFLPELTNTVSFHE